MPVKNFREGFNTPHSASVYPFRHMIELMIRFGVLLKQDRTSALFADIREAATRQVLDWRQRLWSLDELLPLELVGAEGEGAAASWDYFALEARGADGPFRIVLQGPPGAGKSLCLRQFHSKLSAGSLRLDGPSVFIRAKDLCAGHSLGAAVAQELQRSSGSCAWSPEEIHHILESASSPVRGATWLLIDGVDEVPQGERKWLIGYAQWWSGPTCLATRRIREEVPGAWVQTVERLCAPTVATLLRLEGRHDLVGPPDVSHTQVRELSEVAPVLGELTATPLGVSLLAQTVESVERARSMTRQSLIMRGLEALLSRAQEERGLNEELVRSFWNGGDIVVGAAAWNMLVSGHPDFQLSDVRRAAQRLGWRIRDLSDLERVIEYGGFVEPAGAGRWEFAIRSFAEYFAAAFLADLTKRRQAIEAHLARITESSVGEVLVRTAILKEPVEILQVLLAAREHPLTALNLASAIALEVRAEEIPSAVILEILMRRLALETRIETINREDPLHLDRERTGRLLARWPEIVRTHFAEIVAVCHPGVDSLLRGTLDAFVQFELPCSVHETDRAKRIDLDLMPRGARSIAATLRNLRGDSLPVRSELYFARWVPDDTLSARLQQRCSLDLVEQLEVLLVDPAQSIRQVALDMASTLSDATSLRRRLPRLMVYPETEVRYVLRCIAARCGAELRREAILRYVMLYRVIPAEFEVPSIWSDATNDARAGEPFRSATEDLWDLGWDSELLGHLRGEVERVGEREVPALCDRSEQGLAIAFAMLADDMCWRARLRAVTMWHHFDHGHWTTFASNVMGTIRDRAVGLLADSVREVRMAAMDWLIAHGVACPDHLLGHLLESDSPAERCRAWACRSLEEEVHLDVEELLRVISRTPHRVPLPIEAVGRPHKMPSWYVALDDRAACTRLAERAAPGLLSTPSVIKLRKALKSPEHADSARILLQAIASHLFLRDESVSANLDPSSEKLRSMLHEFHSDEGRGAVSDNDCDDDHSDTGDVDDRAEGYRLIREVHEMTDDCSVHERLVRVFLTDSERTWVAERAIRLEDELRPEDRNAVSDHLRSHPLCADGVKAFFATGATERDLVELWQSLGLSWADLFPGRARSDGDAATSERKAARRRDKQRRA